MEAYLALKMLWWLLLGVLLIGLAVMVGTDRGVGTILRYVGRTDAERRVARPRSWRILPAAYRLSLSATDPLWEKLRTAAPHEDIGPSPK